MGGWVINGEGEKSVGVSDENEDEKGEDEKSEEDGDKLEG